MEIGIFGGRFTPLHNGHVGAILRAAEQVDVLFVVLSYAENDPIKGETRLKWMSAVFSQYNNIRILFIKRAKILETVEEWIEDSINIRKAIYDESDMIPLFYHNNFYYGNGYKSVYVHKVFVGSNDHDDMFNKCYPEAKIIVLDPLRSDITISGTEIRKNIYKYWEYLPKFVRKDYAKCIVVSDPNLRNQLTDRFSTVKVEDVYQTYANIYGSKVIKQKEIMEVMEAKSRILCDEAAYNANRVYFVPNFWRSQHTPEIFFTDKISLDDAITIVKMHLE
jgi:HTH-type transcriptional regulator, transcriptional repressor of NAD biosynthesis genes